MNAPHRFLFERSFDQPEAARATQRPAPPAEPTFSKAEVEAALARGIEQGRAAALAEAQQALEARVQVSLASLEAGLAALLAARAAAHAEAEAGALETLRAAMRKLAPALCNATPLAELEAVIADCLREAFDEPRIVMRVADDVFDAVRQRLGVLTTAVGFAGKVVLLADEGLKSGDARIEWAEGGAERDTKRLFHDIDAALKRALDTLAVPGASPTEENGHE